MHRWGPKTETGAGYQGSLSTYDENDISILCLHPRGHARVLVASEVFRIDDSYDCIERERAICLTLEFADLEGESGREGGSTATVII